MSRGGGDIAVGRVPGRGMKGWERTMRLRDTRRRFCRRRSLEGIGRLPWLVLTAVERGRAERDARKESYGEVNRTKGRHGME